MASEAVYPGSECQKPASGAGCASGSVDARAGSRRCDTAGGATGAVSAAGAAWAATVALDPVAGERGPLHPMLLLKLSQRRAGIQAALSYGTLGEGLVDRI